MGTRTTTTPIYGKNERGRRIQIGHKIGQQVVLLGEKLVQEKPKKVKESTTESTKPIRKSLGLRRKKSNR